MQSRVRTDALRIRQSLDLLSYVILGVWLALGGGELQAGGEDFTGFLEVAGRSIAFAQFHVSGQIIRVQLDAEAELLLGQLAELLRSLLAGSSLGRDEGGYRKEFVALVKKAKALAGQ